MDESWRMRMGMESGIPPARKSTDSYSRRPVAATAAAEVEDFSDVFGGPPRSVLTRKYSGDFTRSHSFYDEIFQPPEFVSRTPPSVNKVGRSLPAFRIPGGGNGFYSDVFGLGEYGSGSGGGRRSRERSRTSSKAKSKSNSSSVLSSEDVSPLRRPRAGDDVALSSFASKLRPINVPSRCKAGQPQPKKQGMPAFPYTQPLFFEQDYNLGQSSHCTFSRRAPSPETISLEPTSFRSVKISTDYLGPSSPASSPVSSVCQEAEPTEGIVSGSYVTREPEKVEEEEEDEVMSSYVIEISPDQQRNYWDGGGDAIDIDEAIAWAKERFQGQSPEEESGKEGLLGKECDKEEEEDQNDPKTEEEKVTSEEQIEMELLDEDMSLWSTGKETNIRELLSTLHHILWPNSGWYAIPLANLKDGSQMKKAYQKARLCLHPDKLQQRGATLPQKYVAEKAFNILQDAWAAYISQDGFLN